MRMFFQTRSEAEGSAIKVPSHRLRTFIVTKTSESHLLSAKVSLGSLPMDRAFSGGAFLVYPPRDSGKDYAAGNQPHLLRCLAHFFRAEAAFMDPMTRYVKRH